MARGRYRESLIINDGDTYWVAPPRREVDSTPRWDDIFHVVKQGERLDTIAYHYYANASLWWVITDYNNIFWMFDIEVGQTLRLPSYEKLVMEILS